MRGAARPRHARRAYAQVGLAVLLLAPLLPPTAMAVPLEGSNASASKVCASTADPVVLHDFTSAAADPGANDVVLGYGPQSGDMAAQVYVGMKTRFTKLVVDMGQPGHDGVVSWAYHRAGTGDPTWAPLTVNDASQSFTVGGLHSISWTVPSDWVAAGAVNAGPCSEDYYYVRVSTTTDYTQTPRADRLGVVSFNVRIKVLTELDEPVADLALADFAAQGGSVNTVFAARHLGGGEYDLSLAAADSGEDGTYLLSPISSRFSLGPGLDTGSVTTDLKNLVDDAFRLRYPLKVVVNDVQGNPVMGATVKIGEETANPVVDNHHYFTGSRQGSLSVEKTGYHPLSVDFHRRLSNVTASGQDEPVMITLTGTTPCSESLPVLPGATLACPGLEPVSGPTPSGSSPAAGPSGSDSPPTSGAPVSGPRVPTDARFPDDPDAETHDAGWFGLEAGVAWGLLGAGALLALIAAAVFFVRSRGDRLLADENDEEPEDAESDSGEWVWKAHRGR